MRLKTPLFFILGLLALASLPGCNYIHIGKQTAPISGDNALVVENTDLRLEKKILQEELVIAHKEGAALRAALNSSNSESIGNQNALAIRLRDAAKELGTLRAQNARLQAERTQLQNARGQAQRGFATSQEISDLKTRLSISEGKLAQTTEDYAQAERDNAELRREVSRVRKDNTNLENQVQSLTLQNEQAVAALSQLNNELLAQKAARQRAEDNARSTQAQLQLVMSNPASGATLADTRQSTATSTSELGSGKSEQKVASALTIDLTPVITTEQPTAILRTSPERLKSVTLTQEPPPPSGRYHVVVEGDTLASLAQKYYGKPNLWRLIYVANNSQLGGGRGLKPGMRLEIPRQ